MGTKLYVGNLPFNTTENELQEIFAQAGAVQEVTLMQDRFTGKSRGFAFVTMGSDDEAQNAISKFNGHTMEGRPMTVNEARPREQRPPGGGGGGGGRYGGGGYGGGRRDGGGGQRRGGYNGINVLTKIWAGLDSNQRRRKASRFTVCPVWPLRYLPFWREGFHISSRLTACNSRQLLQLLIALT